MIITYKGWLILSRLAEADLALWNMLSVIDAVESGERWTEMVP